MFRPRIAIGALFARPCGLASFGRPLLHSALPKVLIFHTICQRTAFFSVFLAIVFCPIGLGLSLWAIRVGKAKNKDGVLASGATGIVLSVIMSGIAALLFVFGAGWFGGAFWVVSGLICLGIAIAGLVAAAIIPIKKVKS